MVNDIAFNGSSVLNPFNFQHFDVEFLCLYIDGRQYPAKPYQSRIGEGNCAMIRHQTHQLQSKCSAVCGQYCIFFLNRMCKTNNFSKILATFKENTHWNDMRVCSFVKRLQPNVTCLTFSNNTCIQCSAPIRSCNISMYRFEFCASR